MRTLRRLQTISLTAACLAALTAQPGRAGDVVIFENGLPAAQDIADILFPDNSGRAETARTRGIVFDDVPAAEASPQAEQLAANVADKGDAVGFRINFDLNSADIKPDALPYLDRIAEMMRLEQAQSKSVVIVGHTDASGSASYNQSLSERRAATVQAYLAQRHGIAPGRLHVVGLGEQQPLPGIDPNDGQNRRVEFHPGQ